MSDYPRLDNIKADIAANRADFAAEAAKIQANRDLNNNAKRRMMQEAHQKATERHQALVHDYRARVEETRVDLRQRAFGFRINGTTSQADRIAIRSAHSMALSRVEDAKTPDALRKLLRHASTAEDEILALSVADAAANRGMGDVLDDWLDAYPDRRAPYEEYQHFQAAFGGRQARLNDMFALTGPIMPRDTQ